MSELVVNVATGEVSTRPFAPSDPTPASPLPTPEEKLAAAKAALAAIEALPAPVLTADVVDLLDDLRSVL